MTEHHLLPTCNVLTREGGLPAGGPGPGPPSRAKV